MDDAIKALLGLAVLAAFVSGITSVLLDGKRPAPASVATAVVAAAAGVAVVALTAWQAVR